MRKTTTKERASWPPRANPLTLFVIAAKTPGDIREGQAHTYTNVRVGRFFRFPLCSARVAGFAFCGRERRVLAKIRRTGGGIIAEPGRYSTNMLGARLYSFFN